MTEYEKQTIPNGGENPKSWNHPDINDAFSPLHVADAVEQANKYWKMSTVWEQGVETFARSIQNSISQAWTGVAAEASKAAIQEYVDKQARPLTSGLTELYCRVSEAATAITNTKNALPDPVVVTWTSWAWPPHRWDLNREQAAREEEAQTVMAEHYVTPFGEIDAKIPVLQVPVSPTHSVDIPTPTIDGPGNSPNGSGTPGGSPSGGTPNPGDSGTGGPNNPETPSSEQRTTPTDTDSTGSGTQTTPSGSNSDANSSNTSNTPSSDSAKTTPSAAANAPGTGAGVPGSAGRGSGGSGVGAGGGSGAGRSGNGSNQGQGRSVSNPIGSGAGASGTSSAAAASATRAASGMSGMPGMAGRGNGKDDDSTHGVPDYLITQENTDELLGEIPPTIAGGVIGGDPEQP
ncbi:hypothetical protein [Nocardia arizonensis]|uniref:hypothetical protein n=1 Tax=Nocardia arizonensis TaxID=1141647 RepID=UPI0006D289E4|nr:hypothetical protein [Nocardia arizonensis]